MLVVAVVGGVVFRLWCVVLVRSAILRRRNALWSEPRSMANVDSQSFTDFHNRQLVNM